jgi:hypothetical protein
MYSNIQGHICSEFAEFEFSFQKRLRTFALGDPMGSELTYSYWIFFPVSPKEISLFKKK